MSISNKQWLTKSEQHRDFGAGKATLRWNCIPNTSLTKQGFQNLCVHWPLDELIKWLLTLIQILRNIFESLNGQIAHCTDWRVSDAYICLICTCSSHTLTTLIFHVFAKIEGTKSTYVEECAFRSHICGIVWTLSTARSQSQHAQCHPLHTHTSSTSIESLNVHKSSYWERYAGTINFWGVLSLIYLWETIGHHRIHQFK